jgi:hypothetical protein
MIADTVLRPVLQVLDELERLGPNWDSYGAAPVSRVAVAQARQLVQTVFEQFGASGEGARPDGVSPLVDGGVQVEWSGPHGRIEVEIGPDGTLGCVLDHGRDTEPRVTTMAAATPQDAVQLIRRTVAPLVVA